jgi:hypothetical protein
MGIPVGGRRRDCLADLVPGLEALALEGQGAQDLPPRFDQVQVGGVRGLEDELPPGVGEREEEHIGGAVGAPVVEDGVDPLHPWVDPGLDQFQAGDEVGGGATLGRPRQRLTRRRFERAEDLALAAAAVVDLLLGARGRARGHVNELCSCQALGRFGAHRIQAHPYAPRWRRRVELLDRPLFGAKSGSTRSPNHVSALRQRKPSLKSTSPSRLRFLVMPFCSLR